MSLDQGNRIIRLSEVVSRTGLSASSIYEMIADKRFPRQVPLGKRSVGWSQAEIDEWINAKLEARNRS